MYIDLSSTYQANLSADINKPDSYRKNLNSGSLAKHGKGPDTNTQMVQADPRSFTGGISMQLIIVSV